MRHPCASDGSSDVSSEVDRPPVGLQFCERFSLVSLQASHRCVFSPLVNPIRMCLMKYMCLESVSNISGNSWIATEQFFDRGTVITITVAFACRSWSSASDEYCSAVSVIESWMRAAPVRRVFFFNSSFLGERMLHLTKEEEFRLSELSQLILVVLLSFLSLGMGGEKKDCVFLQISDLIHGWF